MNSRNRLLNLTAVLGLAAGALVAATPTATATATATPACETALMGVLDADGSLVKRSITNSTVTAERKTAGALPVAVSNLLWFDSVQVNGGRVNHIETFVPGSAPRRFSVRDIDAAPNLTVQNGPAYKPGSFSPRLVAGSGRYYIYTIGTSGDLIRWTRLQNAAGQLYYGSAKIVAQNMGGFKTLSYSWSYQLDGKWNDFLYGTTSSGGLKQIRIPWSAPGSETIRYMATSGFAGTTGLSLSFCNENVNYLSVIAINRTTGEARWFTKAGIIQQSGGVTVDRGLVQPDADWHIHATT